MTYVLHSAFWSLSVFITYYHCLPAYQIDFIPDHTCISANFCERLKIAKCNNGTYEYNILQFNTFIK